MSAPAEARSTSAFAQAEVQQADVGAKSGELETPRRENLDTPRKPSSSKIFRGLKRRISRAFDGPTGKLQGETVDGDSAGSTPVTTPTSGRIRAAAPEQEGDHLPSEAEMKQLPVAPEVKQMVAEATSGAVEGSQPSGGANKGSGVTSSGPATSGAAGSQETHAQGPLLVHARLQPMTRSFQKSPLPVERAGSAAPLAGPTASQLLDKSVGGGQGSGPTGGAPAASASAKAESAGTTAPLAGPTASQLLDKSIGGGSGDTPSGGTGGGAPPAGTGAGGSAGGARPAPPQSAGNGSLSEAGGMPLAETPGGAAWVTPSSNPRAGTPLQDAFKQSEVGKKKSGGRRGRRVLGLLGKVVIAAAVVAAGAWTVQNTEAGDRCKSAWENNKGRLPWTHQRGHSEEGVMPLRKGGLPE